MGDGMGHGLVRVVVVRKSVVVPHKMYIDSFSSLVYGIIGVWLGWGGGGGSIDAGRVAEIFVRLRRFG